jgi:hypothetical protein
MNRQEIGFFLPEEGIFPHVLVEHLAFGVMGDVGFLASASSYHC